MARENAPASFAQWGEQPLHPNCNRSSPDMTHPRFTLFSMRRGTGDQKREGSTVKTEALPELKPWREVGWIFRDGDCIAIERKGDETRSRVMVD
jgi:hypothetical protein